MHARAGVLALVLRNHFRRLMSPYSEWHVLRIHGHYRRLARAYAGPRKRLRIPKRQAKSSTLRGDLRGVAARARCRNTAPAISIEYSCRGEKLLVRLNVNNLPRHLSKFHERLPPQNIDIFDTRCKFEIFRHCVVREARK